MAPRAGVLALATVMAGPGCMMLTPQLPPTDHAALETVEDRGAREKAYAENAIYSHKEPQGIRYTKGTDSRSEKRSWQSLDVVLRSDASAAAALPRRQQRLARVFTALTIVAGIVTVAGAAASAREGLNLGELNGTGGLLLGGGLATVGFGITAGIFYGKTRRGYEEAVNVYNDSLGVRLGLYTPEGQYIAPRGTLVDEEGFILLEERERETTLPEEAEPEPPVETAPAEAEAPVDETPATPAAEQPAAEQPEAEQPQPAAEQPAAEQPPAPAAEQPPAAEPEEIVAEPPPTAGPAETVAKRIPLNPR